MKFKISTTRIFIVIASSLAVISCSQAGPIELIYTGDTCDYPKYLNYNIQVPARSMPCQEYKTAKYGYKIDVPASREPEKVRYYFDFTVLKPKIPPSCQEPKLDFYDKIDRILEQKKDYYRPTTEYIPYTSDCSTCANRKFVSPKSSSTRYVQTAESIPNRCDCSSIVASGYISPVSGAYRFTRDSSKHLNNQSMEPATTQIMAIFFAPLQQTSLINSRNKRDISRIFMRPHKNEKRSERIVKQYNKRLTDQVSNTAIFGETIKPIKSRSITLPMSVADVRPLHYKLKNFFHLPSRLRNRRDIKGEYDLIVKEREEMDLTLPEIIQFMPESLDPNFKRGACLFSQFRQNSKSSIDDNSTTASLENETTTITSMSETKEDEDEENDSSDTNAQEIESDNAIGSTHNKRNAAIYGKTCPLALSYNNPTPGPSYTYEPLTNYQTAPRPFVSASTAYGIDPVPQLYVGTSYNPNALAGQNKAQLVGAVYNSPTVKSRTSAQLDQIIAEIVNKHADFIEATSHRGGALVDPIIVQEEQNKSYIKKLLDGFLYTPNSPANLPYLQAPPFTFY